MICLKEFDFDAAHFLPNYNGKCEHLHGHTYKLVVKVEGTPDHEGMVLDFVRFKNLVKELVVSKLVTFQGKNQAVNRTLYVALFSDADCTQKVSNVKELKCEGAWSAYTVFEHLKDGTYYVAVTD